MCLHKTELEPSELENDKAEGQEVEASGAPNAEAEKQDDELAQGFLDMRRGIQRMNRRRDAWTRR